MEIDTGTNREETAKHYMLRVLLQNISDSSLFLEPIFVQEIPTRMPLREHKQQPMLLFPLHGNESWNKNVQTRSKVINKGRAKPNGKF
jgi:hypothetical protein